MANNKRCSKCGSTSGGGVIACPHGSWKSHNIMDTCSAGRRCKHGLDSTHQINRGKNQKGQIIWETCSMFKKCRHGLCDTHQFQTGHCVGARSCPGCGTGFF